MTTPAKPSASTSSAQWNYVGLQVSDGDRVLHPTHVSFDQLIFAEPPNLCAEIVEIIITNNGRSHSSRARVLAHPAGARHIPIELVPMADTLEASSRRTA